MKADSITIQDFFHTERRHLVPLYQRPYVWTRDGQWEPLWEDLRDLAERTLDGIRKEALISPKSAFGIILLAISVKLFAGNITYLFPPAQ